MSADGPAQPATKMRVLLVDDDIDQARLLMRWLGAVNRYDVVHASTGAEGKEMLLGREWDVVILDIQLPDVSGLELLRISKESVRSAPTLLITSHGSVEHAVAAVRGRADEFLIKPLERQAFLARIAELTERAAAERRARGRVVLAIGAHPDDVEIACGGILLRHSAQGDQVAILTLTGGELGGVASERVQEAHRAAEILGARLVLGALSDSAISEGPATISVIEKTIDEVQPVVVYTHTIHDGHQDHRNVHRASVVACRSIPNLYCYQAPSSNIDFRPTKFVEVGEFMDRKVASIGAYQSQVVKRPYLRESLLRATAEYWGRFAQYGIAEPLEVVRETVV